MFIIWFFVYCLVVLPRQVVADEHPVINEFLPHPGTGNKEWVEVYVPDGSDVTNYWLDDDPDFANDTGSSGKKQITSPLQGSDSHHIIFELASSIFNNDGDTIALFTPDGALVDQYQYTIDPGTDVSIGRTPDEIGNFQILASATRGSPNSNPQPTPTETPAPTEKPTHIVTVVPTKALKPTETPKISKSTMSTSPTSNKSILTDAIASSRVKNSALSGIKTGSNGAYPTSILGISTKSAMKKNTPPKQTLVVKGSATTSLFKLIAIIIGGVLLFGCGILIYLKKKGKIK